MAMSIRKVAAAAETPSAKLIGQPLLGPAEVPMAEQMPRLHIKYGSVQEARKPLRMERPDRSAA